MTKKVRILDKERELWSDGDGNWFLNQPEDKMETGIFCGNSLAEWNNHNFLTLIAAGI